jgi:soluble lytic murein transglycosylase
MMWRARISTVVIAPFFLLAVIASIVLTYQTAHARAEAAEAVAIEKVIVHLKNKNVRIREDKLEKVVHAVYKESRQRNLDYRLALAVIEAESNFKQDAVSNKGARGLMQIKPSLAKYIAKDAGVRYNGDRCLHEPEKNIKLGVYHLARLVEDSKNIPTALHAYNVGETKARARTSAREPRTSYTKQVMEEYRKNLSVLPADETGRRVILFPSTSQENGWRPLSSSGKMTSLQLAERPRNVSETFWRHGISRSRMHDYERIFREGGLQSLIDRPHMVSLLNEMPSQVVNLTAAHPSWRQMGATDPAGPHGVWMSSSTVRRICLEEGLGTRHKCVLRL